MVATEKRILWVEGESIMIPIGIPLGKLVVPKGAPQPNGLPVQYAVRHRHIATIYETPGYRTWYASREIMSRARLVEMLAREFRVSEEEVSGGIDSMVRRGQILELSGHWEEDWTDILTLRPIPRGIGIGNSEDDVDSFVVVDPTEEAELHVDCMDYQIYSFWDGSLTVDQAVTAAATYLGASPDVIKERNHRLLINALRFGVVFVDAPSDEAKTP